MAVLGTGCATMPNTVGVTFYSQPDGALLHEHVSNRDIGMAPVRLVYTWDPRFIVGNCLHIQGVTAKWVSGVTTSTTDRIRICGAPGGEFNVSLPRPRNASGLQTDMQFALQVQQTRAIQAQSDAALATQSLMFLQLFNNLYTPRPQLKCKSIVLDPFINTTCY